jgi:hypothetical protein
MASRFQNSTGRPTPSRPSQAPTPTPGNGSTAASETPLPPYKKPSHPLTQAAQDKIRALNDRNIVTLKTYSEKAEKQIIDVAGIINDKLREHEEELAKRRRKWEKGVEDDTSENEEAAYMKFKQEVDKQTKLLEANMRGVIDVGVAARRMEESLSWLHQNAPGQLQQEYTTQMSQRESQRQSQSQRQRRTQNSDGERDEDDSVESEGPTPGPTPLDGSRPVLSGIGEIFDDRLTRKKDEYTSQSLGRRYAENPAYISFKGIVHDAKYQDDQPLPRPDTWFTETGSPAPGVTQRGGEDDDDDDIVMDRATISTRCPITFQRFREPVTSSLCPHTFEKSAIYDMIRSSAMRPGGGRQGGGARAIGCPVAGCSQVCLKLDYHPTCPRFGCTDPTSFRCSQLPTFVTIPYSFESLRAC